MNRGRVIGFSALVILSSVFALLAWSSPSKSFSSASPSAEISLWLYISYTEISEALAVCAFLVWLSPTAGPKRSESAGTRRLGLGLALLGGALWVFRTIGNLFVPSSYILGATRLTSLLEGALKVSAGVPGIAGVSALSVGTIGFALFESGRGRARALGTAIRFFAAPLALFQQITLLAYSPLAMIDHATNILMIWEGGFQPLSNWLVFLVSLLLTTTGIYASTKRGGTAGGSFRGGSREPETMAAEESRRTLGGPGAI